MNLLITGAWSGALKLIPVLERSGHTVVFMQQEQDSLPCSPAAIEGVVCNGLFLHHDISLFTSLRFIQLTSAGADRVPAAYIKAHHIALYTAKGVYSIPMAEHAVMAVLAFYRKLRLYFDNQSKCLWQKDRSLRELCGSTVCIIGCGSAGSACAARFAAFGCRVYGVDVCAAQQPHFDTIFDLKNLGEAASQADAVIVCLPLTPDTEGVLDSRFFARLKKGCVFVNISRGRVVKTADLLQALSKQSLCAALDVFEDEPLPADSPLWQMKNVILTPHVSFAGNGNTERLNDVVMRGIEDGTRNSQKTL